MFERSRRRYMERNRSADFMKQTWQASRLRLWFTGTSHEHDHARVGNLEYSDTTNL